MCAPAAGFGLHGDLLAAAAPFCCLACISLCGEPAQPAKIAPKPRVHEKWFRSGRNANLCAKVRKQCERNSTRFAKTQRGAGGGKGMESWHWLGTHHRHPKVSATFRPYFPSLWCRRVPPAPCHSLASARPANARRQMPGREVNDCQ